MAEDVFHFTPSIPAGTPRAAPVTIGLALPVRIVRSIEWKVPPGPMGTMGFLIAMGGVPVLPVGNVFTYITTDGKDGAWNLKDYPDSGAWQLIGFNTGTNPHAVLLTFHCDLPVKPPTLREPTDPVWFMPSPDLSHAGPPVSGRP